MRSERTVESFSAQLLDKLCQPQSSPDNIGGLWANISHFLRASAEAVVGFERPQKRKQWHDEECSAASTAKNDTYKRTLQSAAMRAIMEDYRQERREERCLIRRRMMEEERRERAKIEMYTRRNDAQTFFKNVKRLTESFKPGALPFRVERDNLATDTQRVLSFLRYCEAMASLTPPLEKTANRYQSG